jgi:hypothetical protein
MNVTRFVALLALAAVVARASEPALGRPPPPEEPKRSPFVFSLLPKSFQKHPSLDFHVISEMTAAGRKLEQPTPSHPVYYIEQPGKFTQLGNNTPAGEHPPSIDDLTRAMENALTASNYRRATPGGPLPSLAIVFNYGSFARFSTDIYDMEESMAMDEVAQAIDPDNPAPPFIRSGDDRDADSLLQIVLSSPPARSDVLKRADLIAGAKFARELAAALNDEASMNQSGQYFAAPRMDASSPFHRFMNANAEMMALVEDSFGSCYFVVASAYDYVAMRKGQRVLLWRTKMTVNSSGISMQESLPSLVVTAGPYFGRDMTDPVTMTRRITRGGTVEVGTPTVVDYSETPYSSQPAPKSEPKK